MNVFLTWSGPYSRDVARALKHWLPHVIQSVKPFMSDEDIEKGARWFTDIATRLHEYQFGVVCLTPDNLEAPWIHFEAGALAKSLDQGRVAPFLLEVRKASISGPLAQFQATEFKKTDVSRLVASINASGDSPLAENQFKKAFETYWPELEEALTKVVERIRKGTTQHRPQRSERELLEEILESTRAIARRTVLLSDSPIRGRQLEQGWPPGTGRESFIAFLGEYLQGRDHELMVTPGGVVLAVPEGLSEEEIARVTERAAIHGIGVIVRAEPPNQA